MTRTPPQDAATRAARLHATLRRFPASLFQFDARMRNPGTGGLLTGFDFTADVVEVDGAPQAKTGRGVRGNPRLVRLDWSEIGG